MAKKQEPEQTTGAGGPRPAAPAAGTPAAPSPGQVPPPPRLRRRPLLALGGLALVVLGALLAAWAYLATSQTTEVIAVRGTVMRGEVIQAGDLVRVQVGVDPALQVVAGDQLDQVVGQRAALDLAAGSLVTGQALAPQVVPAAGESVVGLALTPALMPGEPLLAGDRVRVVVTAGPQGDPAQLESSPLARAEVLDVSPPGLEAAGTLTVVTVLVGQDEATVLAQHAAAGRVALVLDSREH